MLGFDITPRMTDLTDQLLNGSASVATSPNPSIWNRFIACLEMFADSSQLLDRYVLLDLDATATIPANSAFYEFCRQHHDESPLECVNDMLTKALSWYQIDAIKADDWLRESLYRLALSSDNLGWKHHVCSGLLRIFIHLHQTDWTPPTNLEDILERTGQAALTEHPYVQDNAIHATICSLPTEKTVVKWKRSVRLSTKCLRAWSNMNQAVKSSAPSCENWVVHHLYSIPYEMQSSSQPHRVILRR